MTDKKIVQYLRNIFREVIRETETLPKAYRGNNIKAVLLGADPTNNGTKEKKGFIELETVFGINEYDVFFSPQLFNLKAIGLSKDNLYIQNVCRNYFDKETSKNNQWSNVAQVWLPYLKDELDRIDPKKTLPVLVTSEVIMKVLVSENVGKARGIYDNCLTYKSTILEREIIALYRHPSYRLSLEVNDIYREFLIQKLNNSENVALSDNLARKR